MRIGLAQINPLPLAFDGNLKKAQEAYQNLVSQGADLVVFPELTLWGYNAGDFFFSLEHQSHAQRTLELFVQGIGTIPAVIGSVYVDRSQGVTQLFNAAFWCQEASIQHVAKKCRLPYYDVFQENRYFSPAKTPAVVDYKGEKIGILICEDAWTGPFTHEPLSIQNTAQTTRQEIFKENLSDPVAFLAEQNVTCVINLSASPWSHDGIPNGVPLKSQAQKRLEALQRVATTTQAPTIYCNLCGGREEILFDGRSFCLNAKGEITLSLPAFETALCVWDREKNLTPINNHYENERFTDIHNALVFGIKEYAINCNIKQAIIGLSGGIDSALVATLAAEALGPENVLGVSLPSAISSDHSQEDAKTLAEHLNIEFKTIPIEEIFTQFKQNLAPHWQGSTSPLQLAQENLQARIRANLLMSLSNAQNRLLLTTGNKSELAMGYGTLYGDMCGGLNPIGDLYKCEVYALAHHIQNLYKKLGKTAPIPTSTLTKEPSAELSPNQKDSDSLPPYPILDPILKHYIEDNWTQDLLLEQGFEKEVVRSTLQKIQIMEYKRYQSPPILRCRSKAFGVGRRAPIINGYEIK